MTDKPMPTRDQLRDMWFDADEFDDERKLELLFDALGLPKSGSRWWVSTAEGAEFRQVVDGSEEEGLLTHLGAHDLARAVNLMEECKTATAMVIFTDHEHEQHAHWLWGPTMNKNIEPSLRTCDGCGRGTSKVFCPACYGN